MKPVIFIDGREGTTGLQIYDRLTPRQDIELLLIDEEKRKDPAERKKCLNAADLVFLCLPDDAAREAVAMIENPNTRVIDASTAHRTAPRLGLWLSRALPPPPGGDCPFQAGGKPRLPRLGVHFRRLSLVQLGSFPGPPPVRLLPHRLLRRRQEAHPGVPGLQPGPPPRLGSDLRHHPPSQAPAGNGPRLRPGGAPGVPPRVGGLYPGHGHHRHAPQRHPSRRAHGL